MNNNSFKIKATKGKYNFLDRRYRNLIMNTTQSDDNIERWDLYSIIIEEVIKLSGATEFQKIKYRLTGDEDINQVMLDIITKYENDSPLLFSLQEYINNYIEIDWWEKFFD